MESSGTEVLPASKWRTPPRQLQPLLAGKIQAVTEIMQEERAQLRERWVETEQRFLELNAKMLEEALAQQTSQLVTALAAEFRQHCFPSQAVLDAAGPNRFHFSVPSTPAAPPAAESEMGAVGRVSSASARSQEADTPDDDHSPCGWGLDHSAHLRNSWSNRMGSCRSEQDEFWRRQWNMHITSILNGHLKNTAWSTIENFLGVHWGQCRRPEGQPPTIFQRIVESHAFHTFFGVVIIFNTIFIGIQTDVGIRRALADPPVAEPIWFEWAGNAFMVLFVVEVALRFSADPGDYTCGKHYKWNWGDVMLVMCSLLESIMQGTNELSYTRLVRGVHMVRVLRVIRVMRFFRELRVMVSSIVQSLVSLSWALGLLLLIMYLFTIAFTHAATAYIQDHEEVLVGLKENFGSVGTTMFSLLMAISGGVDWVELARPLAEISIFYQMLFAFYVLFVITGILNVLTGTFVQHAVEFSKLDKDLAIQSEMLAQTEFLNTMKGFFEEIDTDGTGKISWEEFREYLQNEHAQAYFAAQQLDTSDARDLFNLLDVDEDQEISLEEFVLGCKRLRGQARSQDVQAILRENKRTSQKNLRAMHALESKLTSLTALVAAMSGGRPPLTEGDMRKVSSSQRGQSCLRLGSAMNFASAR